MQHSFQTVNFSPMFGSEAQLPDVLAAANAEQEQPRDEVMDGQLCECVKGQGEQRTVALDQPDEAARSGFDPEIAARGAGDDPALDGPLH